MRAGVPYIAVLVVVGALVPVAAGMHQPGDRGVTFVFTDRVHDDPGNGLVMQAEEHDPPEEHLAMADRCRLWSAEHGTEVRFAVEPQTVEAQLHVSKEGTPGWLNVSIAVGKLTDGAFEPAGEASLNESPGWEPGVRTYDVALEERQVFEPASDGEGRGDAPAAEVCTNVEDLSEGGASLGVGINSGIEYKGDVPAAYPTPEPSTLLLTLVGVTVVVAWFARAGPSGRGGA